MSALTKTLGDIGTLTAMQDLNKKGYYIFAPVVTEHLPFDFIAYKNGVCYRIQSKYSSSGRIENKTSWNDKHGNHKKQYNKNDFDYYSIYLPKIDKVIYPSINFGGIFIRFEQPKVSGDFWWWEDFQVFTDVARPRKYEKIAPVKHHRFVTEPKIRKSRQDISLSQRKVVRPSKEELYQLIWEKPTLQVAAQFGVSDKAIEKWCKSYGIPKPPRGYWARTKIDANLPSLL